MDEFSRPATLEDPKLLLRSLHEHGADYLMLNANGETYETLSQYAETIELDGVPVKTITLEGLLLTKKTTREKDAADRIIIERALEVFRQCAKEDD